MTTYAYDALARLLKSQVVTPEGDGNTNASIAYTMTGAMRSESNGKSSTYRYDAFGVEQNPTAGDTNPWRYCGEYWDTETQTLYLRARYYDPVIGRFLSEDPIRDGLNWYTYCANNPIRYIDPSGLKAGDVFTSVEAAAIDFAECYYAITSYTLLEQGTVIYSYTDENGNTVYSYSEPVVGTPHSVTPTSAGYPSGATMEAVAHTHPNSSFFSTGDMTYAKNQDKSVYVVVPGGTLKVYEKNVDGDGIETWGTRTVGTYTIRELDIEEKFTLAFKYGPTWNAHVSNEPNCRFRCADKQSGASALYNTLIGFARRDIEMILAKPQ